MALTPCAPCNCIPGNIPDDVFKQNTLIVLCEILDVLGGGGTTLGATVLPQLAVGFAALPATFTVVDFLDAQLKVRKFCVNNGTDADIEISLNGGTSVNYRVRANSNECFDFDGLTFTATQDFFIRYASGFTPTIGTAYFNGSY